MVLRAELHVPVKRPLACNRWHSLAKGHCRQWYAVCSLSVVSLAMLGAAQFRFDIGNPSQLHIENTNVKYCTYYLSIRF